VPARRGAIDALTGIRFNGRRHLFYPSSTRGDRAMQSVLKYLFMVTGVFAAASASAEECVFPGSNTPAPAWICDVPPPAFKGITVVGEDVSPVVALANALTQFAQQFHAKVYRQKQSATKTVTSQVSTATFGRVSVRDLVKAVYIDDKATDREATSHIRLEKPECVYEIKRHVHEDVKTGRFDTSTTINVSNCEFNDLVRELETAGVRILAEIHEPVSRRYYVQLGYTQPTASGKKPGK
jgi:hypothetical protein